MKNKVTIDLEMYDAFKELKSVNDCMNEAVKGKAIIIREIISLKGKSWNEDTLSYTEPARYIASITYDNAQDKSHQHLKDSNDWLEARIKEIEADKTKQIEKLKQRLKTRGRYLAFYIILFFAHVLWSYYHK
jgi:hypothetical protein